LEPLLDWLEQHMGTFSVRPLALRLRIQLPESDVPSKRDLRDALRQRAHESERGRWDVLDAVDYVCRTVPDLWIPADWTGKEPIPGSEPLTVLNRMLALGGLGLPLSQ
jgi:hypothetical protein